MKKRKGSTNAERRAAGQMPVTVWLNEHDKSLLQNKMLNKGMTAADVLREALRAFR
jgi:hypothetical protein